MVKGQGFCLWRCMRRSGRGTGRPRARLRLGRDVRGRDAGGLRRGRARARGRRRGHRSRHQNTKWGSVYRVWRRTGVPTRRGSTPVAAACYGCCDGNSLRAFGCGWQVVRLPLKWGPRCCGRACRRFTRDSPGGGMSRLRGVSGVRASGHDPHSTLALATVSPGPHGPTGSLSPPVRCGQRTCVRPAPRRVRRNPHAAETMAARRPLGTLTNTQPAAAPPKPAPKPAVYRCDHCFSFTGSSRPSRRANDLPLRRAVYQTRRRRRPPRRRRNAASRSGSRLLPLGGLRARSDYSPTRLPAAATFDRSVEQLADVAASESRARRPKKVVLACEEAGPALSVSHRFVLLRPSAMFSAPPETR